MSELQQYYDNFACVPSRWADDDPELCGCGGRGWFLSDLDTWHQCPAHGAGVLHPEIAEANWEQEVFESEHPFLASRQEEERAEDRQEWDRQQAWERSFYTDDDIPF